MASVTVSAVETAARPSVWTSSDIGRADGASGTPAIITPASGQTTRTASAAAAATPRTPVITARDVGYGERAATTRAVTGSAGREAAVHDELGARHERRLVAGQEQRDVRDLARLSDTAERNAGLELLADGVGEIGRLQRRVDDARVDHVAADPVLSELDGERLGERDQRALGRRVGVLGAR